MCTLESFETAIHCLKKGNVKIRRKTWESSEYVFLLTQDNISCSCKDLKVPSHRIFKLNPLLLKKTNTDFEFIQWSPGVDDILSEDWVIFN
jgi:hypothetical protein